MKDEHAKYIKKELQQIINRDKLLCLKSINDSSKWKGIQFLEDVIDDFCRTLIFLIDYDRQNEIPTFINEDEGNLHYWIRFYNEKCGFPAEYNSLYYYFVSKASAIVGFPSAYTNKMIWSETEINDFFKKCESKKPKGKVNAEDFLRHLAGQSFGIELNLAIEKVIVECIQLYNSGALSQKKFDIICQKFERGYEEVIFALDSEDRENLSLAFNKLAEAIYLKKKTL